MTRTKGEWHDFRKRVDWDADALRRTYVEEPQKPGQSMEHFRTELGERFGLSGQRVQEHARRWGWVKERQLCQKLLGLIGADNSDISLRDILDLNPVDEWLHGKHLMMMRDIRQKLEVALKVIPDDDPTKLSAWILAYDRFRKIPIGEAKDAPQMEEAQVSNTAESSRLDDLEGEVEQYIPPYPGAYEKDLVEEQKSRENVEKWKKLSKKDEDMNHLRAGGGLPNEPSV